MKKRATVVEIRGDIATVVFEGTCEGACSGCTSCAGCSKVISATAENKAGAAVGEAVYVYTSSKRQLIMSVCLFLVPIVLFFASFFTLDALKLKTAVSLLISFLLSVVCFFTVAALFKRRNYCPSVITERIDE